MAFSFSLEVLPHSCPAAAGRGHAPPGPERGSSPDDQGRPRQHHHSHPTSPRPQCPWLPPGIPQTFPPPTVFQATRPPATRLPEALLLSGPKEGKWVQGHRVQKSSRDRGGGPSQGSGSRQSRVPTFIACTTASASAPRSCSHWRGRRQLGSRAGWALAGMDCV